MADVSDPAIAQAYQDVRDDKNPLTWVVLGYQDAKKIVVQATGQGNIDELANTLKDDQVQYGYTRVNVGDAASKGIKFVFITWVGPSTPFLKKTRVAIDKANVKEVFRDFALEWYCESKEELDQSKIVAAVMKAGGADYGAGRVR